MTSILGHHIILNYFDKIIEHDNLSHAYAFIGLDQIGKRTVARMLSARLLNVPEAQLLVSPDYWLIERARDEKTDKLKKDISIDQIRELITLLWQSSFIKDNYKIAMIDGAEFMSRSAANALLKTLEEPTGKTVLFLIITDEDAVPPTILSRTERFYFSLAGTEEMEDFARDRGVGEAEAGELVHLAAGRPGRLIGWLSQPDQLVQYKKDRERFYSLLHKPLYDKILSIEALFSDKTDHIAARDNLISILESWRLAVRDLSRDMSISLAPRDIVAIDAAITRAVRYLGENVHPRLLVEHVLLSLP